MARPIMVIAHSGMGKSTSMMQIPKGSIKALPELEILGLDPKTTLLINVKNKPLPVKGWKSNFIPADPVEGTGNYFASTNIKEIIKVIQYFSNKRLDIKNVVIDDMQYTMSETYMLGELDGWEDYTDLGRSVYKMINTGINMREDMNFIVYTHPEIGKDGKFKAKTVGNMLDKNVILEGLFTVVLYGLSRLNPETGKNEKVFLTNEQGEYPAKSPLGMFDELYIPNDIGFVINKFQEYEE